MNTKFAGPLVSAFQNDVKGIVKQELITYRVRDGQFVKETTTRRYNEDQTNWHDSSSIEPLLHLEVD